MYPADAKDFHFSKTSIPSLRHSLPPIRWVQGLFPGVRAAGDDDNSLSPRNEIKGEWTYTYTAPHALMA